MIRQKFLFALAASLLSFGGSSEGREAEPVLPPESSPTTITLGMIPGGNPQKLREQGLALAQELQSQLHISVNIYISKNDAGLIEAMKEKKVDYAFFSSSTYVFAEEQAHAKVLLKTVWQEPYFHSVNHQASVRLLEEKKVDAAAVFPKTTHNLMFALIDIAEASRVQGTYAEILGSHDLMLATSKQYDPVREMVKALSVELNP